MRAWIVLLLAVSAWGQTADEKFFEASVLPVLRTKCLACHSDSNLTSGLSLQSRDMILKGGNRGADPRVIVKAVSHEGDLKMPPGGKLDAAQIAAITQWANAGFPMPQRFLKAKRKGADHWAFQPVNKPAHPAVQQKYWPRNGIDYFILAKLEEKGLQPSPEADKGALLRRVHLDLTGLPPTKKEMDDFLGDTRSDAYERRVEELLASPHYGERWGRHWLDLARYADSDGYTIDAPRDIWMYRDWVIQAVNSDIPFKQFVIDQFAGDLVPKPTTAQLIATGFHRNTPSNYEGGIDFEQYRVEAVADRVATTGSVFMGLTLGCARCHDHKYDPVSQREFYQLFAFLNNVDEIDKEDDRKYFNRPFLELPNNEEKAKLAAWQAQIHVLTKELEQYKATNPPKEDLALKEREANLRALEGRKPKVTSTLVMKEREQPREAYIHLAGDFTRKGAPVQPGTPAVLPPLKIRGAKPNRLDLAEWLVADENPLTPRVTVNRVWQKYFGKGIVDTENDFGAMGDRPTHPLLLDWLAAEFVASGWKQKALHRLIVTSATYRQSSKARPDAAAVDPDNRLLARQSRLRLDAEIIRDTALVASGLFAPKIGGPSVYPPQPAGVYQVTQVRREWKTSTGEDRYRRGMYTFFQRSAPHPGLIVFDAPDSTVTCTRRVRSNTPLQALTMLNDETTAEFADSIAKRVEKEAQADNDRLRLAYQLALNRDPRSDEQERLLRFINVQRDARKGREWTAVARILINLDEFVTRP
ncbi:MAG: PSD1 domain-containing protein [Bryobacterales bacterium]|nr:PSD1 domain-containing protein [Bryobacterales bacterium]